MKKENLIKYILVFMLLVFSCGHEKKQGLKEIILARIGESSISLSEFMRRAEETVRPPYCRGENNVQKKIILNSLIAEKMLALEAGDKNELAENKTFQLYIQGRQEQAMREWLLHEEGFQKVSLDDSEIQKIYKNIGKTYHIQYFNIIADSSKAILKNTFDKKGQFETLHHQLWPHKVIAERDVKWGPKEQQVILKALFYQTLTKNSVVGPIRMSDNNYLVMKVMSWTDNPAISENDRHQSWNALKEKLTTEKALQSYNKFVVSIMKGKKLKFEQSTFNKMAHLIGPLYMRSPKEKRQLFLNAAFKRKMDNPEIQHLADGIDGLLNNSFFRVENQVWSVKDFKEELLRHPLVFRKNLQNKDFAEQFKFAIIDMIRDRYLTVESYKRGYQEVNVVKRNKQMWRDALLAEFEKKHYLKMVVPNLTDSLNTLVAIKNYLNPYVDKLQKKYSDQIKINVEQFDNIRLTRIDMIVIQHNVPFPLVVPNFPQLTTDTNLDYGKQME